MSLRRVEVLVAPECADKVRHLLRDQEALRWWEPPPSSGTAIFCALLEAKHVEGLLDPLQAAFGREESFRALVLPVEATIPLEDKPPEENPDAANNKKGKTRNRISRDELVQALELSAQPNRVFFATVVLSTVVAAIGLVKSSPAIIIGAMVVAPLLGPNMALALATTLGDAKLAGKALKANLLGVATALLLSLAFGLFAGLELRLTEEIELRTKMDVLDLILALAAGAAGALAFTSNVLSSLVGVMVAVALLPPLVVFGMLLSSGWVEQGLGALLLLVGNVVCVLLAATTTFLLQGLGPREWWKERASKRRAFAVIGMLATLLVVLGLLTKLL